ncbi:MAG: 4-hydroxythreonine-4-phosphate dehydrogenase PdxA [Alphaproteobacteria bacterium]|nr:4-hydroxythreonine-4-phosphate dehydrogenase PdxA [Alphaproteobacteria bacterium]
MSKPIAVTMGDPSGIGPELCVKLATEPVLPAAPLIVGDLGLLRETAGRLGLDVAFTDEAQPQAGAVPVLQPGAPLVDPPVGRVDPVCGRAAFDYVTTAIDLAKSGTVAAMVTAPINKESLSAAGLSYPGHTEILADRGGAERVAMMLANDELRTVLVTIHMRLRDAIDAITREAVLAAIRFADEGARGYGVAAPRIAVAGLNPHAGEGGLFGPEEIEIIAPAIAAARAEGLLVVGPLAGDTVFMQARQGRYDVVVAQYHDQGLIPVKYLGLENGVNVTLGLPFVRTSPDHGTAFDIAGQGIADPASLIVAFRHAARMASARRADGS